MCLPLPVLHQWPPTLQAEGGYRTLGCAPGASLGASTDPAALSLAAGDRAPNHAHAVLLP